MNSNSPPSPPELAATPHAGHSTTAESTADVGSTERVPVVPPVKIGRYEVRAVIGEGAFGRVYRAFDPELQREVAIKVPHSIGLKPELRERFLREARAAATIDHPNVCPIYDVGNDGEMPYLVMAFVPGGTLAKLLADRKKPFPAAHAATIVRKIALGVAAAHKKDILHRDLKPANVLWNDVTRGVFVTDFGLARLGDDSQITHSREGMPLGTAAYMSPEQARGRRKEIGPPSDVYSLGVILYQLTTGHLPFQGELLEVLTQVQMDEPKRPSTVRAGLDERLDSLCLKAMEKKAADRFASAKEFATELARYIRLRKTAKKRSRTVTTPTLPVSEPSRDPQPGETREVKIAAGVAMTFCWIPAGTARLGCPKSEPECTPDEEERTRGTFTTNGFWMGKHQVTQAEWAAVMKGTPRATPSKFRFGNSAVAGIPDTSTFPVENISWDDCMAFLNRASAFGGIAEAFGQAGKFVLPHADQWEYACRGGLGNSQPFHWGDELDGSQANCDGNFPYGAESKGRFLGRPCPVGSYELSQPHPWGLCDMHGNVWEWCENQNGSRPERVLCGGSWNDLAKYCRAAYRSWSAPATRSSYNGCRVVLSFD